MAELTSSASGDPQSDTKKFPGTLVLFDVDGTLTRSRLPVTQQMDRFLEQLKNRVDIGLVSGSDIAKIAEQMSVGSGAGTPADSATQINRVVNKFEYVFAENGLVAYRHGRLIGKQSIREKLGEENIQRLINFVLAYLSNIELPVKRGNFVEFRNGMINVSPVGRSCTREEREQFYEYDQQHKIRQQMVDTLKMQFGGPDMDMEFSIGGQISIDCYPQGWDKRFCLQHLRDQYDEIHFFGDRTEPGGNDYQLFQDKRTIGYTVRSPEHTMELLKQMFFK